MCYALPIRKCIKIGQNLSYLLVAYRGADYPGWQSGLGSINWGIKGIGHFMTLGATKLHYAISLSPTLSGACHEDVAASTSRRHAGLSIVRRLAVARPKVSGRRSSSTVLSHLRRSSGSSTPVFGRTPNAGPESSGVVLTGVGTAQLTKEGQAPSTDSI